MEHDPTPNEMMLVMLVCVAIVISFIILWSGTP